MGPVCLIKLTFQRLGLTFVGDYYVIKEDNFHTSNGGHTTHPSPVHGGTVGHVWMRDHEQELPGLN